MEELTAYVAFATLTYSVIKFLDELAVRFLGASLAGYFKVLAAWIGAILVTLLGAATTFAGGIPTFGGLSLAEASLPDQIFFALTVAGGAGVFAAATNKPKTEPQDNTTP